MANRNYNRRGAHASSNSYYPQGGYPRANYGANYITQNSEFARGNYGNWGNKIPTRKRHTGLKVFLVILILLLIVAGVVGYNGYQLYQSAQHVRSQATEAMNDLNIIKADLVAGDSAGAQQAAQSLSQKAKAMNKETDGNLWVLAEKIPVYGEDVKTVRTLTDVLEDVSVNAIEPLCNQMSGFSLKNLIGEGGAINVEQISTLVNQMSTVAPVLQRSADAFNKCPEPHLDQLKGIISKTSTQLNSANELFAFAYRFAPLVPDVFGANGARSYLVVAQNNVEVRATGGFYGSAGMATVDNGKITFGAFSSLSGSPYDEAYVNYDLENTYEHVSIVEFPAHNLYNLGTCPDVPHVAQVFADACSMAGSPIAGVVFVDPVFVQYMVGLTGGMTSSDGTQLDGSNTAKAIMHDTYWTYFNQPEAQDAFFTMVASNAISHVFGSLGSVDMKQFAKVVKDAGEKRHISVWFVDADEQAAMAELGFSGAIPNDPTEAVTGIYFNNESWSKMEWYLHASAEVTSRTKNADGSTSYGVTLSLTNTISNDEALSGNWYVVGGPGHGNNIQYQAGDMLERVYLVAPTGGDIQNISVDGDVFNESWGTIFGDNILNRSVHLLPGETVTFTYTVVTSPQAQGDLKIDMTPLAQDVQ